jgi:hypothetical protein
MNTASILNTPWISMEDFIPQKELEKLFPKEEYAEYQTTMNQELIKKINRHALKFLIVHDQSENSIIKCYSNSPNKLLMLNSAEPKYGFSTLSLAILKMKNQVAKMLIDEGAEITSKDSKGWTPLHYAAVFSDEIYLYLLEKIKKSEKFQEPLTNLGATAEDLRMLTGKIPSLHNKKVTFLDQKGEVHKIGLENLSEFAKLCSFSRYMDEPLFCGKFLKELWCDLSTEDISAFEPIYNKICCEILKNPPALIITEDKAMKEKLGETSPFYTLLAGEDLEGRRGIEFTGRHTTFARGFWDDCVEGRVGDGRWAMDGFDAKQEGNAARFINDGWPNMAIIYVHNFRGLVERIFFVTTEKVEANQPLYFDYGTNARDKWGIKHVIGNLENMCEFFKKNSPELLLDRIIGIQTELKNAMLKASNQKTDENQIKLLCEGVCLYESLKAKWQYALSTPTALIELTVRRIVKPSIWKAYLEKINKQFGDESYDLFVWQMNLIKLLIDFDNKLTMLVENEKGKELYAVISDYISSLHGKLKVTKIIKAIEMITKLEKFNLEDFKLLMNQMQSEMPSYDWTKDEDFPLLEQYQKEMFKHKDKFKQYMNFTG